jgi:hypothetical protein
MSRASSFTNLLAVEQCCPGSYFSLVLASDLSLAPALQPALPQPAEFLSCLDISAVLPAMQSSVL